MDELANDLATELNAVFLLKKKKVLTERELVLGNELFEPGRTQQGLNTLKMSLSELLLSRPDLFTRIAGDQWAGKGNEEFATVMTDNKNTGKGKKGGGGVGGGRGFNGGYPRGVSNRGRGGRGGSARGMPPQSRGNSSRPSSSVHEFPFRPVFQPPPPAPAVNFNNQRPLRPMQYDNFNSSFDRHRGNNEPPKAPPKFNNDNYKSHRNDYDDYVPNNNFGRRDIDTGDFNASRGFFDESVYDQDSYNIKDRRRYSPRRHSPSPPPPPPPRPYRGNSPPPQVRRGPDAYDSRRNAPHPPPSPMSYQNGAYGNRRAPSPVRPRMRSPSPVRSRMRSPSPVRYHMRSPSPAQQRLLPSRAAQYHISRDEQVPNSRAYEQRNGNGPMRSRSGSGFSQISNSPEPVQPAKSSAKLRSKMRAEATVNESNDLAKLFSDMGGISSGNDTSQSAATPRALPKNNVTAEFVARTVQALDTRFQGKELHVADLFNYMSRYTQVPAESDDEKLEYIISAKNQFPEEFGPLVLNTKTRILTWKQKEIMTIDDREDDLFHFIRRFIDTFPNDDFYVRDALAKLVKVTKESEEVLRPKLNYLLSIGKFRYKNGNEIITKNFPNDEDNGPTFFWAPSCHQMADKEECPQRFFKLKENQVPSARVEICCFHSFDKFFVRLIEDDAPHKRMDEDLQQFMSSSEHKYYAAKVWKRGYACIVRHEEPGMLPRWYRGVVLSKETSNTFRVFLIDVGTMQLFSADRMHTMPNRFSEERPYAIPCKLDYTDKEEDDIMEIRVQHSRWVNHVRQNRRRFQILVVNIEADKGLEFGMYTCHMNVFVEGLNDTPADVFSCFFNN
ncbi:unnamed protein product [Caenorhabditis sp. 36 PRJEB53466]|nr:unnamed protein product [Caenorhabditis sp. 36 PRJEB53466]